MLLNRFTHYATEGEKYKEFPRIDLNSFQGWELRGTS